MKKSVFSFTYIAAVVCCAAACVSAYAQLTPPAALVANTQSLPPSVLEALKKANVPLDSVAVIVKDVNARDALISLNADKPMNPASVMKLFTTYAGLELLGPGYTWKTEVYAGGEIRNGTLYGDFILKGGGDPKLTVERFWLLLKQLRERGLQTVRGDLVLDRSLFEPIAYEPAKFDGEPPVWRVE